MKNAFTLFLLLLLPVIANTSLADEPIVMRIESLLLAPTHTPSVVVVARNPATEAYQGTLRIETPDGWTLKPTELPITLDADATGRFQFMVLQGRQTPENRYELAAVATSSGRTVRHARSVVAASTPYFKPTIDGLLDEWGDAIPVSFTTADKRTTISTYWNRRSFSMLVAVEEDALTTGDAVQFALAAGSATTGDSPEDEVRRFEFLLQSPGDDSDEENAPGRCYRLARPGMTLAQTQQRRPLAGLLDEDAALRVVRRQRVTYYELSLSFSPMRDTIRPSEGREFCLSVLIHDPDGTGLRDWGEAVGLWPEERSRLAWSDWPGVRWGETPPMDGKTPWGFCSSKY